MAKDLEFFDSNVLIAASIPYHVHHAPSIARLSAVRKGAGVCGAHSLAEIYSNLTNRSKGYAVPSLDAARIVDQFTRLFTVVALTPKESRRAIQEAAQLGISGPMIYDCLLLACARKASATRIYTLNPRHFRAAAPDLANRIHEP
jgi:predicted nucleic acid-binding protein